MSWKHLSLPKCQSEEVLFLVQKGPSLSRFCSDNINRKNVLNKHFFYIRLLPIILSISYVTHQVNTLDGWER